MKESQENGTRGALGAWVNLPMGHSRRFGEGRESVEDDKRSGPPQISYTTENIEKVSAAERMNRLQTMAESVGISLAICQWILTKDLSMHRVCQHIVSRMLNEDQSADEADCRLNERTWLKMDFRNVSMTFTSYGKSVLLFKSLISKEDVFQQFNW
ncbi:uncharacterized protein TNCV_173221 [Trichonephila clavipes]|nr:uncharacterized protein TNCV_173221 [Trichonephila clavipes]